jgi:hypothetical protein
MRITCSDNLAIDKFDAICHIEMKVSSGLVLLKLGITLKVKGESACQKVLADSHSLHFDNWGSNHIHINT